MAFEDGTLYWSPRAGRSILVPGPILTKYRRLGGPASALGYPETWVRTTAHGAYTRFRHGVIRFDEDTNRTTVRYE